jgi:hypothetical protein
MKRAALLCAALIFASLTAAQNESQTASGKSARVNCAALMKFAWNANQRGAAQADCEFYNISIEKGGDAWGEFAASEATLPRGKGKEEIRKASIALYSRPGFRLLWKPDQEQPFGSSFVVTSGRWERHIENSAGKEEISHGGYVTVWQKQNDGSWRFVWDGGEADPQK